LTLTAFFYKEVVFLFLGTSYLDSPETIEALEWVASLIRKHGVSPNTNKWHSIDDFLEERVGMIAAWGGADEPDFSGVTTLPSFPGKTKCVPMNFRGFAISSNTQHPDLAWELLYDLTFQENELLRSAHIPALKSLQKEPKFQNKDAQALLKNIEYAVPFTDFDLLKPLFPVIAGIGESDAKIEEMMKELVTLLNSQS
jgi:ABC-type glycerol-3-phosphate transport system substrate-binding protein